MKAAMEKCSKSRFYSGSVNKVSSWKMD